MNSVLPLLATGMFAAIVTAVCIPYIIRMAHKRSLLDQPGGRKQHSRAVPALGGIAIFAGFVASGFFWIDGGVVSEIRFLFPALLLLFATGIVDDVHALSPMKKLAMQVVAALLVTAGGFRFENLYGFMGMSQMALPLQIVVTVLFLILMTNAFNLIDGVDGLAGGIGLTISFIFAVLFYQAGNAFYAALCVALTGALAGFLYYNFNPASIFMGDTGSLIIGFLLGVVGVRFCNETPETLQSIGILNPFVVVCCVLFLPVFDVIRVFLVRLAKKLSPFHADRNHLHHILQKNNLTAPKVCAVAYSATFLFTLTGIWMLQYIPGTAAFLLLLSGSVVLAEVLTVTHLRRSKRKLEFRNDRISSLHRQNQFLRHVVNL